MSRTKPVTLDPIPETMAKAQWKETHTTEGEGLEWIPITGETPKNWSALRYANGWVYDRVLKQMNVNPWRHIDD